MNLELRWLQIDLARQKENVDFVKSYADFAVECGYNGLLLYLENAVRTKDTYFFGKDETYSEAEIKEIIDYAEAKGLEVVPALENLGHLEKFFLYSELEKLSEITDYKTEGRGFDSYPRGACGCVTNPDLNKFFDKYLRDVCSLFHSKYVHMGLDEPFDLAVCENCKAEMNKGTKKSTLFLNHVLHTYKLCKSMGKTMMMWDDFFEYADIVRELPRDIVLCNWNYVFVGDEPQGHWTNRIKKDWFRLYDELGFSYVFCCYAHRASSCYNVDTFTDYASKYDPLGAIMTTWKRSDSFYQGAYPSIAYCGAKWQGKIKTEQDKIQLFANILGGNEKIAGLVSSLNIVENGGNFNITEYAEGDYMLKLAYRDLLGYVLPEIDKAVTSANGRAHDILLDIYDYISEIYLKLRLQRLGVELFDNYEKQIRPQEYFVSEIETIKNRFETLRQNACYLWNKYRKGIVSYLKQFENKYQSIENKLNDLSAKVKNMQDERQKGVLYVELMLHDPYPTVKNAVYVMYEGESEELLFKGSLKPTVALFEWGGCYSYRFALKAKKIEYVRFVAFGEGEICPLHFRYTLNGKKYVASEIASQSGKVSDVENLLYDDTRFARMGECDGIAHFNDIALSKAEHSVTIKFSRLK